MRKVLLQAIATSQAKLDGVMNPKAKPDDLTLRPTAVGDSSSSTGLDPEEARIFRQSLPAEEVTRDFLQELLEEHRANQKAKISSTGGL